MASGCCSSSRPSRTSGEWRILPSDGGDGMSTPPTVRAGGFGPPSWRSQRATEAEVEPSREGGVEQAELLDDGQGRPVAELHTTGADPDACGDGSSEGDQDRRIGRRHAGVEVVLGEPVAVVAEPLRLLRKVDRAPERLGRRLTGGHRHQVEDGQGDRRAAHDRPPRPGPSGARPRWSRRVVPSYSSRKAPRSCSKGTTSSAKRSSPPGVTWGTRMNPSQTRSSTKRSIFSATVRAEPTKDCRALVSIMSWRMDRCFSAAS